MRTSEHTLHPNFVERRRKGEVRGMNLPFPLFSASSVSSSSILASKARDRESTHKGGAQATHDGRSPVPPNKARSGRAVFVRHPSYAGRRPYGPIRLGVYGLQGLDPVFVAFVY